MTDYTVIRTERHSGGRMRVWRRREDDGTLHTHSFHVDVITGRAAEYGLTDVREALDLLLLEGVGGLDVNAPVREDPAVAAGWVTGTSPDAEPVFLYNARSTADARGAHRARCEGAGHRVVDPDGLLDQSVVGLALDPVLLRRHREFVDTHRWERVYGGLPAAPVDSTRRVGRHA